MNRAAPVTQRSVTRRLPARKQLASNTAKSATVKMPRSGRTRGPRPTTMEATRHSEEDGGVDKVRTSSQKHTANHKRMSPVSSPEVAKSQTAGMEAKTSAPRGSRMILVESRL